MSITTINYSGDRTLIESLLLWVLIADYADGSDHSYQHLMFHSQLDVHVDRKKIFARCPVLNLVPFDRESDAESN